MPPRKSRSVPSHTEALAFALADLDLAVTDDAAKRLAVSYAQALDEMPGLLEKVGPQYLAVLAALGLTPVARAALAKGVPGAAPPAGSDQLARLRAERAASR